MVIKRELLGRWSSKGSWWGGGHQKGADGEVVIKNEMVEGGHQQGAVGEEVIKRELVGRWSSKGS